MKKILSIGLAVLFVVSFAVVSIAAEEMFSLKGPVVSVDAKAKTVTVHSVEGVTTAADNRWKGNVIFATNDMTTIMMGKEKKAFGDLKAGQELKVKFHQKEGKSIAVEIMIMAGKKASGY
jgi:hypothetical protein